MRQEGASVATARDADALYRETLGGGPPLLVMHGGLGWDHTCFRPWLDDLARDFTVIYYDHRGNGRSPRPDDWAAVTHASWADDAAAVLDSLGLDRATVLGHSYGGFIALELALRHPERIERLILADTAPALDYPDVIMANAQARGTPEQVEAVVGVLTEGARDDEHLREIMRTILPLYFEEYTDGGFKQVLGSTAFSAAALNHAFGTCAPAYDLTGRLGEIEIPAQVLVGRHDWICPVEQGSERLRDGLPNAKLVVFERSGHFPWVEETKAFLDAVREMAPA